MMCVLLAACAKEYPVQATEGDGWRWLGGTEQVPAKVPIEEVTSTEDLAVIWDVSDSWDTNTMPEVDFANEAIVVVESLGRIRGVSICTARIVDVEPEDSGVVRLEVRSSSTDGPCELDIVNSLVLLSLDRSVFGEPPYSVKISYD